jgi:hypothetical protein
MSFTFNKDILPAAFLYLIGIFSLLPGVIVGEKILAIWYVIIFLVMFSKKPEYVITIYIIWLFLGPGAWHYQLLGESRYSFMLSHIDEALLVAMAGLLYIKSRDRNKALQKYINISILLAFVVVFSGLANGVGLTNLINYFSSNNFRWFFLLFTLTTIRLPKTFLQKQIILIFTIIMINSVFGLFQTILLPDQMAPDGYTPSRVDAASGLTGLTNAQRLSVLCVGLSIYFFLRYLSGQGRQNLFLVFIILLQVATTDSKSVVVFGILIYATLFVYLFITKQIKIEVRALLRLVMIGGLLFSMTLFYSAYNADTNQATFIGRTINYIDEKQSIADFQKITGYIQSVSVVSTSGYLGMVIGVGPTNFASTIGLRKGSNLIKSVGFDAEALGALSSASSKKTDFSVILGEIGIVGGAIFLFLILNIFFTTLRKVGKVSNEEDKIFTLFLATWLGFMILMTLYTEGWLWDQFAIVSLIFLVYDHKYIHTKQVQS